MATTVTAAQPDTDDLSAESQNDPMVLRTID